MPRFKKMFAVDLVAITTLAGLAGCPLAGCASMAKFSPEQVQSIKDVSTALVQAAHDSGASGVAIVHLGPVRAELTQGVALSGLEATVVIQANPAATAQPEPTLNVNPRQPAPANP